MHDTIGERTLEMGEGKSEPAEAISALGGQERRKGGPQERAGVSREEPLVHCFRITERTEAFLVPVCKESDEGNGLELRHQEGRKEGIQTEICTVQLPWPLQSWQHMELLYKRQLQILGPIVQHLCLSVTIVTVTPRGVVVGLANDGQSVFPELTHSDDTCGR